MESSGGKVCLTIGVIAQMFLCELTAHEQIKEFPPVRSMNYY